MTDRPFDSVTLHASLAPPAASDEGGLRPPDDLHGWRRAWWWFHFVILVKLARLRFIAILIVIGLVITQWDYLAAVYNRATRAVWGDETAAASDTEWFCPMHPTIVRDNPRDKCPICFMPLSKRKKGNVEAEVLPAGVVNRVQLSPYRIALAGVQTSKVAFLPLTKEITAVGFVEFNERGQRTVSARVNGRIDRLLVSETGRIVKEGDELALLYSPELVVSVENLLQAKRANNRELMETILTRLRRLGIDDDQTKEILASNTATTQLKIRSPMSGHVIKKYVREGQYVQEGMPLYDLADLSTVWIQAQVYEDDVAFLLLEQSHGELKEPLPVTATTRSFPNDPLQGTLAFIFPHFDQDTRTVTVRFELANPGHILRPGGTATVTLHAPPARLEVFRAATKDDAEARKQLEAGKLLAIPESAVIDTGSQKIVYREASPGVYEGVRVELGPRMAGPEGLDYLPVIKGLAEGDLVVASGSFLVDAETRLNPAAGSIYFGGSSGKGNATATAVRPSTPEDVDRKVVANLAKLSTADRKLAEAQRECPILHSPLGAMGVPVKLTVDGETVFVCCPSCKEEALANGPATLRKVKELKQRGGKTTTPTPPKDEKEATIAANLGKLSAEDRKLAEAQGYCPILTRNRLGAMGVPKKIIIDGQCVFLCCPGCEDEAREKSAATLAKARELRAQATP